MVEEINKKIVHMIVNGQDHHIEVRPNELLIDVLRDRLGLTGTKISCEAGDCGACTVLVNGIPTLSCLTLAIECSGHEIQTIEGVRGHTLGQLHPLQKAFVDHYGVQCGFCTPAMILTAKALLEKNPNPMEYEVRDAINGVICRCTGYMQIIESILAAAREMRREADE